LKRRRDSLKTVSVTVKRRRGTTAAHVHGQELAKRFSAISRVDRDRAELFGDAIQRGKEQAAARDEEAFELSQDDDFLKDMGF
jgi:hypothetical protein